MFGVLLESRARRQRRSGGIALSAVTHLALIGLATAATAARPVKPPLKPVVVHLDPPPPPKPVKPARVVRESSRSTAPSPTLAQVVVRHIEVPTTVPTSLPAIDMTRGLSADSIVIGSGRDGHTGDGGLGRFNFDEKPSSGEWSGNELLMRMVASGKPRYPESLRQSGIEGTVLIQFMVDTLGRIDPSSVRVVKTTHELFTQAVRQALSSFRFRPAEAGGKRVPALAEMPFEFAITK